MSENGTDPTRPGDNSQRGKRSTGFGVDPPAGCAISWTTILLVLAGVALLVLGAVAAIAYRAGTAHG